MKIQIERVHDSATRVALTEIGPNRQALFDRVHDLLVEATTPLMIKDSAFHFTVTHKDADTTPWIEVLLYCKHSHLLDGTLGIRKLVHQHLLKRAASIGLKAADVELKTPEEVLP